MSKNIPEWEFWDWTSILDTLLLVGFFVATFAILLYGPISLMRHKEKSYDKVAIATVSNIKKNIHLSESFIGNNVYLHSVTVDYKFEVDSRIFSGSELIPYETISEKRLLYRLMNKWGDTLSIKYLSKDPTKSLVIIGDD